MKLNRFYIFFAIIFTCGQVFAQPTPYYGTFLFNLTEQQYRSKLMTVDDLKKKGIRFLSFDKESVIKYDTVNNAFSITAKGFETKHFAIVHKNDTILIDYPSIQGVSIFIKAPIPLKGSKGYSFSNEYINDAISSNKDKYLNSIFYLCQGCLLSRYEMKKEIIKSLKESIHWQTVELKEE
ncbi:MAG: hypothetical protein LAT51_13480 [Flavobacteriaceae bacterium]|nr:hypothetical protein [Flavobacteriaceae bacterium]